MNSTTMANDNVFIPNVEAKLVCDDQCVRDISLYPGESNQEITRTEILDFGNEGFLLKNVLSQEECKYYIQETEALYEEMPGVKKAYRNNTRFVFMYTLYDSQWRSYTVASVWV